MADDGSSFQYLGHGDGIAVQVAGPTVESCLARAVEGVGNAIASVHPSVASRPVAVAVEGDSPAELLRCLLDAVAERLDRHGEVALGLADPVHDGRSLHATLRVVPLAATRGPRRSGPPSPLDVDLRPNGDGWRGVVVLAS